MATGGHTGRCHLQVRFRLHRIHQLACVLVRRSRIHADHRDVGDMQEQMPILDAGVQHAQRLVGAQVLCRACCPGVTIARRFPCVLGANGACRAGLVDHHDFLAQHFFNFCSGNPTDLIGRATSRPRNDQVDGFVWFPGGLCESDTGQAQTEAHSSHQAFERLTFFHGKSPWLNIEMKLEGALAKPAL